MAGQMHHFGPQHHIINKSRRRTQSQSFHSQGDPKTQSLAQARHHHFQIEPHHSAAALHFGEVVAHLQALGPVRRARLTRIVTDRRSDPRAPVRPRRPVIDLGHTSV
jgi:hypothetical protein